MEGYSKTDKNGLNKITNDNIYDIDPIMENFTLLDDSIGKVSSVNMEGYNEDSEVGSEKSLTNYIKYLWKKLGSIELTDEKITVTSDGNKTLKEVLKGIIKSIKDVKEAEILDRKSINILNNELTGVDALLKEDNEKFAQLLGVNIEDIRGGI